MLLKLPERLTGTSEWLKKKKETCKGLCTVGVDKGGGELEMKLFAVITDQRPIIEKDICL